MKKEDSQEKQNLKKELVKLADTLIRGSLIHSRRKCGSKTCACANGGEKHPMTTLSISTTHARNRQVYISADLVNAVENGIASYKRAWEIIEELSAMNLMELKEAKKQAKRTRIQQ